MRCKIGIKSTGGGLQYSTNYTIKQSCRVVDDLVGGLGVSFPTNTKYTRSPTNPPTIRIYCFRVKFIYIKTIFYLEYCF